MEMLKSSNWMLWKCRMLVVLQDLGLEKCIAKDASVPGEAKKVLTGAHRQDTQVKGLNEERYTR